LRAYLAASQGYQRRAQYLRTYQTPHWLQKMGQRRRRWSDEEMLQALRTLQAEAGGVLTRSYLEAHGPTAPGQYPSAAAVVTRFGSWQRVSELLGQPYHGRRPRPGKRVARRHWSDEEMVAALRAVQAEAGGLLTPSFLNRRRTKAAGGRYPSAQAVVARFGSCRRVCELLGQPAPGRAGNARGWTNGAVGVW
jgi:hypothetical protein